MFHRAFLLHVVTSCIPRTFAVLDKKSTVEILGLSHMVSLNKSIAQHKATHPHPQVVQELKKWRDTDPTVAGLVDQITNSSIEKVAYATQNIEDAKVRLKGLATSKASGNHNLEIRQLKSAANASAAAAEEAARSKVEIIDVESLAKVLGQKYQEFNVNTEILKELRSFDESTTPDEFGISEAGLAAFEEHMGKLRLKKALTCKAGVCCNKHYSSPCNTVPGADPGPCGMGSGWYMCCFNECSSRDGIHM